MDYWRQKRGSGYTAETEDRFLHAPAEKIPVADESYDVVSASPEAMKYFTLAFGLHVHCWPSLRAKSVIQQATDSDS